MRCRRARQAPAAARRVSSLLRDGIAERALARRHALDGAPVRDRPCPCRWARAQAAVKRTNQFSPFAVFGRLSAHSAVWSGALDHAEGIVRAASRDLQRRSSGFGPRGKLARRSGGWRRAWRRIVMQPPTKKPDLFRRTGFFAVYSLAVTSFRFTILFGMGGRGSRLLWPPDRRKMRK